MYIEAENLCISTFPIRRNLEELILEDAVRSIQHERYASNPLIRHFAHRTPEAMQTLSDFGWTDFEFKHYYPRCSRFDTRYYHFDAPPPRTLYPNVELRIKYANVMPDQLALIRKIEKEFPDEKYRSDVLFWRKLYGDTDIFFVEGSTYRDLGMEIDEAIRAYRSYGNLLGWTAGTRIPIPTWGAGRTQPIAEIIQNEREVAVTFVELAAIAAEIWGRAEFTEGPEEGEVKHGAVSEGHYGEKDHSKFEKTGKTVSADDIDDLLDRITADTEENQVKEPEE